MTAQDLLRERKRTQLAIETSAASVIAAVAETKGAAEGLAELDPDGKVPTEQLPELPGSSITIDTSGAVGALMGSGVTNLQELADWLDANL